MKAAGKKQGFTLIELMVTIASASIVMLLVATVLFMGYLSWRVNGEYVRVQEDAALAVRMIAEGVHESATNEITTVSGAITFDPNAIRADELAYVQVDDSLRRYINGADSGLVIMQGLSSFEPQLVNDGVLIELVLTDTDDEAEVSVTNRVFINTRNRL